MTSRKSAKSSKKLDKTKVNESNLENDAMSGFGEPESNRKENDKQTATSDTDDSLVTQYHTKFRKNYDIRNKKYKIRNKEILDTNSCIRTQGCGANIVYSHQPPKQNCCSGKSTKRINEICSQFNSPCSHLQKLGTPSCTRLAVNDSKYTRPLLKPSRCGCVCPAPKQRTTIEDLECRLRPSCSNAGASCNFNPYRKGRSHQASRARLGNQTCSTIPPCNTFNTRAACVTNFYTRLPMFCRSTEDVAKTKAIAARPFGARLAVKESKYTRSILKPSRCECVCPTLKQRTPFEELECKLRRRRETLRRLIVSHL